MKIGIIDDDTQFSQVIKNKIEENTCFSKSSIDVFNNDFQSSDTWEHSENLFSLFCKSTS